MVGELVETHTNVSPTAYVTVVIVVAVVAAIILLMHKLRYTRQQVVKAVVTSIIITAILEAAYFLVGSAMNLFLVMCKIGAHCPGQFEIFANSLPYTAAALFLLVLLIYSIVDWVRRR